MKEFIAMPTERRRLVCTEAGGGEVIQNVSPRIASYFGQW